MTVGAPSGGSSYANDVQSMLDGLAVGLRVLVWGPGETASKKKWFEKRAEVVKALREASNGRDTVVTSEELFNLGAPPPVESGYAELVHAGKADVIIALVLASPSRQGGVYRELEIIAQYRDLRDKVYIFLPDHKGYLSRFQAGMLHAYREDRKIPLSWNMLETCVRLRDICVSKVNEERKQRMFDRLIAAMHSSGQLFP